MLLIDILEVCLALGLVYCYFNQGKREKGRIDVAVSDALSIHTEYQSHKVRVNKATQTDIDRRRHGKVLEKSMIGALFNEEVQKQSQLSPNSTQESTKVSRFAPVTENLVKSPKLVEPIPYMGSVNFHQDKRPLELFVVLNGDFIPREVAKGYLQSQQQLIWDQSVIKVERQISSIHESKTFNPIVPMYTIWILHTSEEHSDDEIPYRCISYRYTRTVNEILRAKFLNSVDEIFADTGQWITIEIKKLVGRPAIEKLAELGNQTC